MKKNKLNINWKDIDDVIFIPKKRGHILRNSLIGFVSLIFVIIFFFLGDILNAFFIFPKENLVYSDKTNVYCEDRDVPMGGAYYNKTDKEIAQQIQNRVVPTDGTILDNPNWQYESELKTDFVGQISNNYWLPAKNVKLGVRIQGINNPGTKWWMGSIVIEEVPANSTVDFSARLNHFCSQRDIKYSFEVTEVLF